MRLRFLATALCASALMSAPASAEGPWPSREIRMITPYAAGSGTADAIARLFADRLKEIWGQGVVVDNIAGAAGSIGIGRFVREKPDGYTIAMSGDAPIAVNISLQRNLTYDPRKDLVPIVLVGRAPNILVVNAEKGPKTLADLVEAAKRRPGTLTFSSTGVGTSQHIAIEQLRLLGGADVVHVPGRGATAPDIMGGHVDASFMNVAVALPHVRAGTLRALGQSGPTRAAGAPDIPTIAEQGYPALTPSHGSAFSRQRAHRMLSFARSTRTCPLCWQTLHSVPADPDGRRPGRAFVARGIPAPHPCGDRPDGRLHQDRGHQGRLTCRPSPNARPGS